MARRRARDKTTLSSEEGVREVIRNIVADIDLTAGLAGCRSVDEITVDRLARLPHD